MRYARSALITLFSKGLAIPVGILSSIITARTLGPSGRGVIIFLLALQGLVIQFGSFGLNASITYFMSRDRGLSGPIVSTVSITGLVFGVLISLGLLLLSALFPQFILGEIDTIYLHAFILSIPSSLLIQLLQNVFLAHERIYAFNGLDLAFRLTQFLSFFVFLVLLKRGALTAVWCITASTIAASVLYMTSVARIAPIRFRFDGSLFSKMFRYGGRTYAASILMYLLLRSSIFLINSYLGQSESGIYSIALQIVDIAYLVPTTLGMVLFPKVSADPRDQGLLTAKVFRFTLYFMLGLSGVLFWLGEPVVVFLYGDQFGEAVPALLWLLPGMISLSLVTILNNDLAGRGFPRVIIWATAFALVLNVTGLVVFLPVFGIILAGASSSFSSVVMLIILGGFFMKSQNIGWRELLVPRRSDFAILETLQK